MMRKDIRISGKIGYRAGQFYDAGAGSGRKAHAVDDAFQQGLALGRKRAEFSDLPVVHGCIAEDALSLKPSLLQGSGLKHAGSHSRTRLSFLPAYQATSIYSRNNQLYIYTIK